MSLAVSSRCIFDVLLLIKKINRSFSTASYFARPLPVAVLSKRIHLTYGEQMQSQLYLGVYESELEAAKAHDRAARFHFPDKSMTNFATEAEADLLISDQEVRSVCALIGNIDR